MALHEFCEARIITEPTSKIDEKGNIQTTTLVRCNICPIKCVLKTNALEDMVYQTAAESAESLLPEDCVKRI